MDILDFDQLLSPISEERPCGESLRYDPAWGELSQLRKWDRNPFDSSADVPPDWQKVIALSSELLATRTKDLLIAGWLTEAVVREYGLAGLRDGLRLIRQLIERYWDGLYPLIEDGDLSLRASPLVWLAEKEGGARLPATLRTVALANSQTETVCDSNFWHARNAAPMGKEEDLSNFEARKVDAEGRKKEFDDAVDATPLDFYRARYAELDDCLHEIRSLSGLTDEKLGDEHAMSWSDLSKAVADIQVFIRDVLKRRGGFETANAGESEMAAEAGGPAGSAQGVSGISGALRSRADAISRLEEVARFFSTMDPHSPVAFLIRRAVRWANMSFEDLLVELVRDDNTLKHVTETLGIGGSYGGSSPASSE